jgi:hypothetical protein
MKAAHPAADRTLFNFQGGSGRRLRTEMLNELFEIAIHQISAHIKGCLYVMERDTFLQL